jgi:hypothetical protein
VAAQVENLMTKGDFARLINVSPGRITQMISERKIGPDALVGEGRSAKIRADLARRQIVDRTDIGQRFGNGLATQLDLPTAEAPAGEAPPTAAPAPTASLSPVTDAIARERLRSLQLSNERAAEDRLAEQGRYVRTDQTRAAMTKMAASMLTVFEGGLADLAAAVAAKHALVQRDVLHQLRAEFRKIRIQAAETVRRDMANLPRLLEDEVPDATDPALGQA